MTTFRVSSILLICLYILYNQGFEAKVLRHHHGGHHHGRHHHGKNRSVVPQQDYPKAEDYANDYLAVAKLRGYITKRFKNPASTNIKKNRTVLKTEDRLEYTFFPTTAGSIQFKVRAANDAHIALSCSAAERDPMYEVFIGGWGNARSAILKNHFVPHAADVKTPGILNGSEFRGFWVRWSYGTITAGNQANSTPFLTYTDSERLRIEYVGVRTGHGASGSWIIEQGDRGHWVAAKDGEVPLGAYPAGKEKEKFMYIIRSDFRTTESFPGKLVEGETRGYVTWGGSSYATVKYEVLCDFGGDWQQLSGNATIPRNAIVGGKNQEGKPLYIGRVKHESNLIVGKIQAGDGTCLVSYEDREKSFTEYEILVS